jgi:hypothetical protein
MINIFSFKSIEIPKFVEIRGKDWISFGEDNLFPQKLIELKNSSAIHNTCIESTTDAVCGEGLEAIGDYLVNTNDESLNELYRKIALDYVMFNGFALNIIWNRSGDRIAEIYHIPFDKVRSGKLNEEDVVMEYFYSSNWNNTRKYTPKKYPAYDNTNTKGDNASQIFYFKTYHPGNDIYPLPTYIGALNDIQLDGRISVYHNNNINNGMSPGLIITFPNGIPTDDEKRKIYNDLNDAFASEKNAGKVFLNFSDGLELAPKIETLTPPNDDYYIQLENRISSRVLTAHRISSPLLLGIRETGTGLGNNANEMEVAYTHFLSVVVQPKQKEINKSLQWILRSFGLNVSVQVIPTKLDFNQSIQQ